MRPRATALAVLSTAALVAVGLPAGASAKAHKKVSTVTLAQTSSSLVFAPIEIAEAKGYFTQLGIKVVPTIVSGDAETVPAVLSARSTLAPGRSRRSSRGW